MRCLMLLILLLAAGAQAAVPPILNFQGKVTDSVGLPMDTTVSITFAIYDDQVGTTQLWQEVHPSVVVRDGIFQVMLGGSTALGPSVLDGSVRYIGMAVAGGEMPDTLIPIVSVAYAMNAASSDTAAHAHHSRRADTATIALSGGGGSGGGWVDAGTTVTLENSNDSVGIGTDDPGYPLDVQSSQIAISGKSTGSGLAIGVMGTNESSGVGVMGSSTSGSGVYGHSTTGKAGWFQGDAYIAGHLGIHTQTPEERLHIYENGYGTGCYALLEAAHATNWSETGLRIKTPQNTWSLRMDGNDNTFIPDGSFGIRSQYSNVEALTITRDGRVGINKTSPLYPLDVQSATIALRGRTTGGDGDAGVLGEASGTGIGIGVAGSSPYGRAVSGISTFGFGGYFYGPKSYVSGNLGIGTEDPTHKLTVNGAIAIQSGGDTKFHINYYNGGFNISETTVGDYRINVEQGGNVGIGTGNPQEKLHVAGNLRVDGKLTADSIFSSSIVDEAGAASVLQGHDNAIDLTGSYQNIISRQITVPGPGVVLALASSSISIDHSWNNLDIFYAGVSSTSGTIALSRRIFGTVSFDVASGYYTFPISCQGLFEVSSRGAYTFYLVASRSGSSPAHISNGNLSLVYLPSTYGTVAKSDNLADGSQYDDARVVSHSRRNDNPAGVDAISELQDMRAELDALRKKVEALEK